jgi:hypothetical protein
MGIYSGDFPRASYRQHLSDTLWNQKIDLTKKTQEIPRGPTVRLHEFSGRFGRIFHLTR